MGDTDLYARILKTKWVSFRFSLGFL
jgi:hypothetical protein